MRIVILRGGAQRRPRPSGADAAAGPASAPSTRERGVMAIGNGSGQWVLVNMSPAVAHQLDSDTRLDHHAGLPDADVRAVLLTDAQVDHVGGLLSLRDGAPIDLYATPAVFEALTTTLPVLPVLQHYCGVHWHVVPVAGDRRVSSFHVEGMPTLEFTALATQAPPPPHLAHTDHPSVGGSIALAVRDLVTGQRVFCAPGLTQIGPLEFEWMREADCLLMDGQGNGNGQQPWLSLLGQLPARHKVLLGEMADLGDPDDPHTRGSPGDDGAPHRPAEPSGGPASREDAIRRGIAVAYDGMEIAL